MAHYARVLNGFVTHVIVADQDFINSGAVGDPSEWIQTSYNTRGGIHYGEDGNPDGGIALRKNYASIGYMYLQNLDAFVPPKPFAIGGVDWTLDENTGLWTHPTQEETLLTAIPQPPPLVSIGSTQPEVPIVPNPPGSGG